MSPIATLSLIRRSIGWPISFNLDTALIQDAGDGVQSYDSIWMLLTRDRGFLHLPAIADRSVQRPPIPPVCQYGLMTIAICCKSSTNRGLVIVHQAALTKAW